MKFKDSLSDQEKHLFKDTIGKVKPMVQDKITQKIKKNITKAKIDKNKQVKVHAQFHFSPAPATRSHCPPAPTIVLLLELAQNDLKILTFFEY